MEVHARLLPSRRAAEHAHQRHLAQLAVRERRDNRVELGVWLRMREVDVDDSEREVARRRDGRSLVVAAIGGYRKVSS